MWPLKCFFFWMLEQQLRASQRVLGPGDVLFPLLLQALLRGLSTGFISHLLRLWARALIFSVLETGRGCSMPPGAHGGKGSMTYGLVPCACI